MRDDALDAAAAALEHARQAAGLALQVEAQREPVHVLEHFEREAAYGVHRHGREHRVAPLRQQRHQDARQAVDQHKSDRRGGQRGDGNVVLAGGHQRSR